MKTYHNVLDDIQCDSLMNYILDKVSTPKDRNLNNFPWHENDSVGYQDVDAQQ